MSAKEYLAWLAGREGTTRREFMARAAALGVSTTVASSLAAKATFAEEAPKTGGHLILGLDGASSTDSLDPATYPATYLYTVGFQWGNCLVEMDENNRAIPELAESWDRNADATRWVFKIRKGVEFHNGKSLTAADVVHSINHHRGENSQSAVKGIVETMTDVKVTDTHEVTVSLAEPNLDMPYLLSDYHILIMPEGSPPNAGIGTGGYVIESFEPGVRTLARRNQNYWKEGRAHVDTVETLAINDLAARTTAVQTGAAHFVNRIDPKTVSLLKRRPDIRIISVPTAGHNVFPMRCDTPPFDNKDLRIALKYAIDRQELVDKILQGYGKLGNDHPIPKFDPFFSADIPQHTYDPERAKHHFTKSGVSGPITLYIADAAFTGAVDAATLFKQQAAKAGIEIIVQRVPEDGYWSEVWMQKPFCGSYWVGRATADLMLSFGYQSDAAWNESFWRREDFDKLLKQARAEVDTSKRKQMYHDMQMMIWEDGGALIPMFNNFIFASQDRLAGLVPAPVMTGFRAAEQLYFTT